MPNTFPANSVGLVTPVVRHFAEPVLLSCGRELADYDIVYETYGSLNADRSNAVLICHALSGHHHAAGYHSVDDKKPGRFVHLRRGNTYAIGMVHRIPHVRDQLLQIGIIGTNLFAYFPQYGMAVSYYR